MASQGGGLTGIFKSLIQSSNKNQPYGPNTLYVESFLAKLRKLAKHQWRAIHLTTDWSDHMMQIFASGWSNEEVYLWGARAATEAKKITEEHLNYFASASASANNLERIRSSIKKVSAVAGGCACALVYLGHLTDREEFEVIYKPFEELIPFSQLQGS